MRPFGPACKHCFGPVTPFAIRRGETSDLIDNPTSAVNAKIRQYVGSGRHEAGRGGRFQGDQPRRRRRPLEVKGGVALSAYVAKC